MGINGYVAGYIIISSVSAVNSKPSQPKLIHIV